MPALSTKAEVKTVKEVVVVQARYRIEYEDVPGARKHALQKILTDLPYEVVGCHVQRGLYRAKRTKRAKEVK